VRPFLQAGKIALPEWGVRTKNWTPHSEDIDVEKLRSDYNALYSKKQALQKNL